MIDMSSWMNEGMILFYSTNEKNKDASSRYNKINECLETIPNLARMKPVDSQLLTDLSNYPHIIISSLNLFKQK